MDQLTEVTGQGLEQNAGVEIVITNKSSSQVHSPVRTRALETPSPNTLPCTCSVPQNKFIYTQCKNRGRQGASHVREDATIESGQTFPLSDDLEGLPETSVLYSAAGL